MVEYPCEHLKEGLLTENNLDMHQCYHHADGTAESNLPRIY